MRKRDLRSEKRWAILFDFLTLLLVSTIYLFLMYNYRNIGVKSYVASGAVYVVLVMMFMYTLDEYKIFVSELYEQTVIFVLSGLYSLVLLSLVDVFVLMSLKTISLHCGLFLVCTVALFLENMLFSKILSNPRLFRKQRLLIIETDNQDFKRMKRIKYGTMKNYDSWYESVDTTNLDEIDDLINNKLCGYDAVCLLDKVKEDIYLKISKAAVLNDIDLYVVPKLSDIGRSDAEFSHFDDVLTLYVPGYNIGGAYRFLKRATDIVFSSVLLIIAAVPMLIISLAIKLTSPGNVFYKQVRLTQNKKEFYIYKFRTMVQNAEKTSGPVLARKNDDRITPVGKILRACRLDELPQLINILKGDMSVVGPRPERPFFVEQFEKQFDSYDFRFKVKAGLTALSHVYGRYSTYTYDRTCFDLMYITHYSYFLDIKIMLLTSKIMFLKSAAEGEDEYKLAGTQISNVSGESRKTEEIH